MLVLVLVSSTRSCVGSMDKERACFSATTTKAVDIKLVFGVGREGRSNRESQWGVGGGAIVVS